MAEFCLGTAQLGMQYGIANFSSIPDQIQINKIISKSLSNGIRYFDTAPFYGHGLSEHRLGHILHQKIRSEFILSSKVGRVYSPFNGNPSDFNGSP